MIARAQEEANDDIRRLSADVAALVRHAGLKPVAQAESRAAGSPLTLARSSFALNRARSVSPARLSRPAAAGSFEYYGGGGDPAGETGGAAKAASPSVNTSPSFAESPEWVRRVGEAVERALAPRLRRLAQDISRPLQAELRRLADESRAESGDQGVVTEAR